MSELYKSSMGIIYNDKAEIILNKLKNKVKVDAIITDPPYNVSRKNNFHTIGRSGFDFGPWDKNFDQIGWLKLASNLLKPGGSIIIFNDWKNLGIICASLRKLGCIEKDIIVWQKSNPMPRNRKRRYLPSLEFIFWGVKKNNSESKWTFNIPKKSSSKIPILKYAIKGLNRIHPTQKPLPLLEDLISTHTNTGDVILDPFSGSGSLCVAATKLKRKFIAIESNREYFMKSKEWVEKLEKKEMPNEN